LIAGPDALSQFRTRPKDNDTTRRNYVPFLRPFRVASKQGSLVAGMEGAEPGNHHPAVGDDRIAQSIQALVYQIAEMALADPRRLIRGLG